MKKNEPVTCENCFWARGRSLLCTCPAGEGCYRDNHSQPDHELGGDYQEKKVDVIMPPRDPDDWGHVDGYDWEQEQKREWEE